MKMKIWDYKIPKNWQPKTDYEWQWYLERKINYDDFRGLNMAKTKKFLNKLKIDEGKKLLLKAYFKHYGK
ncbi:MAG: Uncharacterized protein CEN89_770 [Candidatus Berkelbacteria bacterium Licking1014_7]|uniref:Uncharacterized protein n=1 Tax=Candidatus Berkelbacteria bacterium Licking1014_7 TaxID=2017147 RepID=A0A554LHD8_9BACT|nr:MAG: Uncharacterized protein CEN89_770 [Candidatus Berkelbacteria bacterium Licking1014_7]